MVVSIKGYTKYVKQSIMQNGKDMNCLAIAGGNMSYCVVQHAGFSRFIRLFLSLFPIREAWEDVLHHITVGSDHNVVQIPPFLFPKIKYKKLMAVEGAHFVMHQRY